MKTVSAPDFYFAFQTLPGTAAVGDKRNVLVRKTEALFPVPLKSKIPLSEFSLEFVFTKDGWEPVESVTITSAPSTPLERVPGFQGKDAAGGDEDFSNPGRCHQVSPVGRCALMAGHEGAHVT